MFSQAERSMPLSGFSFGAVPTSAILPSSSSSSSSYVPCIFLCVFTVLQPENDDDGFSCGTRITGPQCGETTC